LAETPTFYGIVKNGIFRADRPAELKSRLTGLEGQRVQVTMQKRGAKVSLPQSRYWFGVVIPLLAEHFGYDMDERKALHYQLMAMCFGTRTETRLGVEMEVVNVESMTKLSTADFEKLADWTRRWAAKEHSVYVPEPNEAPTSVDDYA
jgi:hypothetical protein